MFWFFRGVAKGVVTTRYPARRDEWSDSLPTPPAFRGDLLTVELAERLVSACPASALRREEADLVLDIGACTACGACAAVGGEAVVPSGEFELAARRRSALVKRIAIGATR